MATKQTQASKKKPRTKRLVVEIAPAVRALLDTHMSVHNEGEERVASTLKYTDVINQALDEFLPPQAKPGSDVTEKKPLKAKQEKARKER
jgi:hypothetical protein